MAFSKVILLGEHAVVYGYPALAGALSRGISVTATPRASGPTTIAVPAWNARVSTDDDSPLGAALRALVDATGAGPMELVADARVPPGAGLGSSAALSVAVARALAPDADTDAIEALANRAETHFHDNPSGVDVALAARGGLGLYRRGEGLAPIDAPPLPLAVGFSGEPRSTADMVRKVATVADARRDDLAALGEAAQAGADALTRGAPNELGPLFRDAHVRLARLGVSTAALDRLVELALDAGALGAKLTGGGGGGAVIALAPDGEDAVIDAWRELEVDAFTSLCGVTV